MFALLLVTLIIPFQVVLVPNFVLYRFLPHPASASGNWIGTQEPLWVGAFLGGAFGTFLLRQFFLAIPQRARRRRPGRRCEPVAHLSAHLPAAGQARPGDPGHLHVHVVLERPHRPDHLPARHRAFTLTAGLSLFQGQYVGRWPLLMAGALVSVIPMILLFVVAQRQFVRGIAMTGIKG